jgi:tripartite-type tricarboxylate transporter receptor subunit TctC
MAGAGVAFAAILTCAWSSSAFAQQSGATGYPNKPVRMIVSFAAGNVTDVVARILTEKLTEKWGQAVIVDNKPGQAGSLGTQLAARAPADGYNVLFSAVAAMAINVHVYEKIGYDPIKDFVPITNVAYVPSLIGGSTLLKARTLRDLTEFSKANPAALSYGTNGSGTGAHLNMEAIKAMSGMNAQHIPYKAATTGITDLIAGRLQLQVLAAGLLIPHVKSGKIVAVASVSSKRLAQLPDTPTVAEALPGFVPLLPWVGLFAPSGTPTAIINKFHQDVLATLQMRDVQEKFDSMGLVITGEGTDAFRKVLASDYERLGRLVKELDIKVD